MWLSQVCINVRVRPNEVFKAHFREKSLSSSKKETVPQTDTGDQVEQTKTNEWLILKELGKKAAVS